MRWRKALGHANDDTVVATDNRNFFPPPPPSVSDIAKTFVQVCRGDDKCITITVYFVKTATREKGCGSCL